MFKKILIANRGEIALRIIKTARRLNIKTVAIYSSIDKNAMHVLQADEAYEVGPAQTSQSYLNIENIINAAIASKAQAIHPGYGFLSENSKFAQACEKSKIIFIGPLVHALETMGSKQASKQILQNANIPLIPGYHGNEQNEEKLLLEAKKIGFPILIKAALGGGGKGMRVVENEQDFQLALKSAQREATAYFNDDTIILEKYLTQPRHIEVQIMADNYGNIIHLFERDCSIQRRHQKIIEEAPALNLPSNVRQNLHNAALTIANEINYRGAGTIEFLVEGNNFYFMEMNTRLQVEHPVTEMITGIDLVEWQLKIAANEKLPLEQKDIIANGHAIECRVYAEDPVNDFMPSTGIISFLQEPQVKDVRIDSAISLNSTVSMYYDPLIAKIIAWGKDRHVARENLLNALKNYHVGGIKNNIQFLKAILSNKDFINNKFDTNFLANHQLKLPAFNKEIAILLAASFDYILNAPAKHNLLANDTFAWQLHLHSTWKNCYCIEDENIKTIINPLDCQNVQITIHDKTYTCSVKLKNNLMTLTTDNQKIQVYVEKQFDSFIFYGEDGVAKVTRFTWDNLQNTSKTKNDELTSPMPATIVEIVKKKGEKITQGERLIVLEAMKMEHIIVAPADGILTEIFYKVGEQVTEGALLGAMEKTRHAKAS